MDLNNLFLNLYNASTERDVDIVIARFSSILDDPCNWYPLDNNESNFGFYAHP